MAATGIVADGTQNQFPPASAPGPYWSHKRSTDAQEAFRSRRNADQRRQRARRQALAKIERGHPRDFIDVDAMIERGLVARDRLWDFFLEIESRLLRYPSIDPAAFRASVAAISPPAQ